MRSLVYSYHPNLAGSGGATGGWGRVVQCVVLLLEAAENAAGAGTGAGTGAGAGAGAGTGAGAGAGAGAKSSTPSKPSFTPPRVLPVSESWAQLKLRLGASKRGAGGGAGVGAGVGAGAGAGAALSLSSLGPPSNRAAVTNRTKVLRSSLLEFSLPLLSGLATGKSR